MIMIFADFKVLKDYFQKDKNNKKNKIIANIEILGMKN